MVVQFPIESKNVILSKEDPFVPNPFLILKSALFSLGSRGLLAEALLLQARCLVSYFCRLNREDTLNLSQTWGKIHSVNKSTSKKRYSCLLFTIEDLKTKQRKSHSQILLDWIERYGHARGKTLRLSGSGWQEVSVQIRDPSHPSANDDGLAWYTLSMLVPKNVRALKENVVFEWLTNLFPIPQYRIDNSKKAFLFLQGLQNILIYIPRSEILSLADKVDSAENNNVESLEIKEEREELEETIYHIEKRMLRNQGNGMVNNEIWIDNFDSWESMEVLNNRAADNYQIFL